MASNNSDVNSDVAEKAWFSVEELAEMHLPGYPRSGRRMHDRARAEGWKSRQVASSGRTGMKTEYSPPPSLIALILSVKDGRDRFFGDVKGLTKVEPKNAAREPEAVSPPAAPDGFVLVPRYDVHGSMGNGHIIHSEQIVDHLAFRSNWVRTELGTSPANLVLISAIGDSMEPTLRAGDLLLIDRSVRSVKQDAIYAFATNGELRVKRMQLKMDGCLVVKSDNSSYEAEILTPEQASTVHLVGRVVWSGRRM